MSACRIPIPSPTISVRTGGREIGFIIIRGKSIGIFPSKDDAARALWRHDRSCWTTIGDAANAIEGAVSS
jgi:hypothetical protein